MHRITVPCRGCDGHGFHRSSDEEGNAVLDNCQWCYRGRLTFRLTDEDVADLQEQLQNLVPKVSGV